MPTWREVIEDEGYQKLPLGEKVKTKNEFFSNTISQSDKFKNLSPQEKSSIKKEFFTPKPEESLSPFSEEKPSFGGVIRTAVEEFQQHSPFKYLDKPVEEVAKFIEPDTAEEGVMGALGFLLRQVPADFIRGYKPTSVAPFAIGAKIIKPIAKPVGKFIASKTPEAVKNVLRPVGEFLSKNLTVGKGQPQAYQAQAEQAALERGIGGREAEQVAKTLATNPATGKVLSTDEQKLVGSIFRKEVNLDVIKNTNPELYDIAQSGRSVMDKWSKALADSGIPKEETSKVIEENIGSYMARMYRSKLKPEAGGMGIFKDLRLRLNGLKHRKDLSVDVRDLMGEIKEPALPTAIRVKEISTTIANNKLFSKVASNPEWVADKNVTGKLIKMPDSVSVGALKGKWVIPEIAEDINAITKAGEQSNGLYLKALSAWKYGKVVLNPAAQARNALSNTILLDLSGTSHLRQAQLFPKAFDTILSKNDLYKQMLDDGAIGGEFAGTETMQKLKDMYIGAQENNLQKWMRIAGTPFRKAGELYQGMEQTAKAVKYLDVLEKTGDRKLAAQEAQKWLFNYDKVPKFIDWARKSPLGAPFITFCVSVDTQILTNKGWKFSDEINVGDETLAYQIETNRLEWQEIKKVNIFPYSGRMLHIKSRSLDILMTPDHRNIVLHRNKKNYVRQVKLAKDLNSRDGIIVAGEYIAPINKTIEDYMVRLVGWFVTEGFVVTCSRAFLLGQTNKEGQKEIEDLRKRLKIDKYNVQLRRYKLGGYKLHKVYYFPSFIRDRVLKFAPGKKLTTEFLKLLTKDQLEMLYNVLLLADGCNTGSQPVLIQNPGETADNMQILGVMLGKQFGWSIKKNCLAITITKGKSRQLKRNLPKSLDYQGLVWCPQTDYGTWVARRNGKVFITGNTYKSIPRIAEAMVNRPMAVYKYKALFDAVNETSRKYQGMSPVDYAREKKALPPWVLKDIGGVPTNVLLPWKDKYNRTQWLNLEYILPVGQVPEMAEQGVRGFVSSPAFNILADIIKNTDFKNTQIVPPEATKTEAAQAVAGYIYRQLVPSLAPGGYSFEKIRAGFAKEPERFNPERTREAIPALLDSLVGLKINPVDVEEAEQFQMWDKKRRIDAVNKELYRVFNNPVLKEDFRDKKIEDLFNKKMKIIEE